MYPETRKGTRSCVLAVALGIADGKTSSMTMRVDAVLDATPFLDVRSKADIRSACLDLAASASSFKKDPSKLIQFLSFHPDGVMKAWNRAYRRAWKRMAENVVKTGLRFHRFQEDPIVFYMVSWHQLPQPAHKDLQGTLLIDRQWRNALMETGDDVLLKRVAEYVKVQKIRTVQWAMGEPHWLIVRPNCKHYLIPMRTSAVLNSDPKSLKAMVRPDNRPQHRPITDQMRWAQYKELRLQIASDLRSKAMPRLRAKAELKMR